MKRFTFIALMAAASLVGACATSKPAIPAGSSGSVKTNIAAQAITPPAAQKANRNIPQDRALRDAARKRYREDAVKAPKTLTTQ